MYSPKTRNACPPPPKPSPFSKSISPPPLFGYLLSPCNSLSPPRLIRDPTTRQDIRRKGKRGTNGGGAERGMRQKPAKREATRPTESKHPIPSRYDEQE